MEDFKTPELPDMTNIRASYEKLLQAHEDLNKARRLRNRGIAELVVGMAMLGVGIRMLRNQK